MVFKSAWIPAPPPESDPATVKTRGIISKFFPLLIDLRVAIREDLGGLWFQLAEELIHGQHLAQEREDLLFGVLLIFGGIGRGGVFDNGHTISFVIRSAGCTLDAKIGQKPGHRYVFDFASLEQTFQVGVVETAEGALAADGLVGRLGLQFIDNRRTPGSLTESIGLGDGLNDPLHLVLIAVFRVENEGGMND